MKEATVETALYGSKFNDARACVDQIIDLVTLFGYLGMSIRDMSYMFGNNKSVVDSTTNMNAKPHKQHSILSLHCVHECIASKIVMFFFVPDTFKRMIR
jgi:hypothetical protein